MSYKKISIYIAALLIVCILMMFLLPTIIETAATTATQYQYTNRIFNESTVTSVNIEISESDWQNLLENPMNETYYLANITIGNTTVNNVGIRTKGNSSLSSVASSDSDRYSFKIDFSYYDSSQSLYGLTKLNLNNQMSDSSSMREFLSYELMEEMGVATPAHSYMYISINGEEFGLYLGVEQINETFLSNNFDDGSGDLYKPDSTSLEWTSDSIDDYTNLYLKTNEDSSDQSAMISLLDVINNGGDLESVMDVDQVIRYFAANTALVSMDSYQGSTRHNYYLYEQDGLFSIIPWDYNMSFGGFTMGGAGGGFSGMMNEDSEAQGDNSDQSNAEGQETVPPDNNIGSEAESDNSSSSSSAEQEQAAPGFNGNEPPTDIPQNGADGEQFPSGGGMQQQSPGDMAGGEMPDQRANGQDSAQGQPAQDGFDDSSSNEQAENNTDENAQEGFENNNGPQGGGMGGGLMGDSGFVNQDAIDFTIDTPVSGVSLDRSPLITSWLNNDEYKEIYHSYLEEIANGFLSEERMTVMVATIADMISPYIAKDPTAFFTVDEFNSAISGDDSIIEFSKQRSESILLQLSGEKESTTDTSSYGSGGMGGGAGFGADNEGNENAYGAIQNGGGMMMPPDQQQGNEAGNIPSEIPDDIQEQIENGEFQPPNMQEGQQNADRQGMGMQYNQSQNTIDFNYVVTICICVVLLLIGILFARLFARRGFKQRMFSAG